MADMNEGWRRLGDSGYQNRVFATLYVHMYSICMHICTEHIESPSLGAIPHSYQPWCQCTKVQGGQDS